MNSKVRDLFRIETKDIVTFQNFNQIYYVFEQMVLYDVDVPEIEGLSERLSNALEKVASEKLDRNDIITFFPIIWGKFEPYARKILYIVNPSKYEKIHGNNNSSLVNVLEKLGVKVFVQKRSDRTKETDAIFTTYKLRNAEAHECETWSVRKCYDNLAKALSAFLIITNKALSDIQLVMEGVPEEKRIKGPLLQDIATIQVDIFDARVTEDIFYNLNDFFSNYQRIGNWEYDRNGWLISSSNITEEYESVTSYDYEYKENRIVKCNLIKNTLRPKLGNEPKQEAEGYYEYYYNDQKQIIKIKRFLRDTRSESFSLNTIIGVEYLTDGRISITKKDFHKKINLTWNTKDKEENEIKCTVERIYNQEGQLVKKIMDKDNIVTFIYSNNGMLSRIENPDYSFDEIKYIGENVFRIRTNRNEESGQIVEKRLYTQGRLKKIQYYKNQEQEGNKTSDPVLSKEMTIEYFDEK